MSVPDRMPREHRPVPPERPTNVLHEVAAGIGQVVGAPMVAVDALNTGFATTTQSIAQAFPSFPAGTMACLTIGAPHAHVAHPPSGPPPVPPTPLPPIGPIIAGCCVQVLIGGLPAARCGDIILNPPCCGLPPLGEVKTGSSNVFIGGARAARMTDITMHCTPVPAGAGARAAAGAARTAAKTAMTAMRAVQVAGMAAQGMLAAGDAIEAVEADDSAMSAALGTSAKMLAAQVAADAAAMALAAAMGKDPCLPPTGTPGMVAIGVPNVLIGGFPMPMWMNIARGLLKGVKGLRSRNNGGRKPAHNQSRTAGHPIDLVTGANIDEFLDVELPGPIAFRWQRFYDSALNNNVSPLGWGFRHEYQRVLRRNLEGFEYITQMGHVVGFPSHAPGRDGVANDGFLLRQVGDDAFEIDEPGQPTMEFDLGEGPASGALKALRLGPARLDFIYDGNGWLVAIRSSNGSSIGIENDPHGHLVELRLFAAGESAPKVLAAYRYDESGNLIAWQDATAAIARYEYDSERRMTRNMYRNGYSFHYEYDRSGRCIRTYGDDGLYDVSVEYRPLERTTIARYADGATSIYRYDANGTLSEITDPAGGVERFLTDAEGRVVQQVDPAGNVTRWLYDNRGGHFARVDPLGYVNRPMHIEPNPPDPLGYHLPETPLQWEFGNRLPADQIKAGDCTDPLLAGLAKSLVSAVASAQWPRSPPLDSSPGSPRDAGEISRSLDDMGRVIEEVDPDGYVQKWKYNASGQVIEHQDRDGSVEKLVYSSWKGLAQRISPIGAKTCFDYTVREYLTRITDAGGTVNEYIYDHSDRVVEVRYDGQLEESYRRDVAGNLVEKTDSEERTLLTFDIGPGNLARVRRLASGDTHTFEYDDRGRFTVAANNECRATFAYDASGRMLEDLRDGLGVRHAFRGGEISSTSYFDRFRVSYKRDADGTLVITDPTGAAHRMKVSPGGWMVRGLANGTTEVCRYDRHGRCLVKARSGRNQSLQPRVSAYSYSGEGDLQRVVESHEGVTQFRYDAAHRLAEQYLPDGSRFEFVHDDAGNLIRQPGLQGVSLGSGNRLRTAIGDAFAYNHRNAISGRQGSRGSVRYEYDSLDALVRCDIYGETWTTKYDAFCRRVSKTWRGRTTTFYWDDFRLAAEIGHNGSVRVYVYLDEVALVPFMLVEYESQGADPRGGRRYYLFTNQIGVPVRAEDDTGRVVWSARVAPFGRADVRAGSSLDIPLRFPGHYFDAETGLHCNRFRYYSPELGRYLESDPLGIAGGINLYAYCANPLTQVDIDGLAHRRQQSQSAGGASRAGSSSRAPGARRAKPRRESRRLKFMGRTPGKRSATGRAVIARMREKTPPRILPLHGEPKKFQASDDEWYPIKYADMAHDPMDAVTFWNKKGRYFGPRSQKVRDFMLDSDNYVLDHRSINRRAGATSGERYKPALKKPFRS